MEQSFLPVSNQITQVSQADKAEIDTVIHRFLETHQQNQAYMTQLTIESVTALTAGDARAKALARQNFLERFWYLLTGRNQQAQARIHTDFACAQYASQQLIQQVAAQNLMTFEMVTAVNNKLNTLILEQDREINEMYKQLGQFFKQIRSEISLLKDVVDDVKLLKWSYAIEYQVHDGKEYASLSDVEKIVYITNDFFCLTKGQWKTGDLMILKKTFADVGLPVKNALSLNQLFTELLSKPPLIARLFENVAKESLRNLQAYDTPMLKGIEKLERLNGSEKYLVESVAEALNRHHVACPAEEIHLILLRNYLKQEAYTETEKELNLFDVVLDLLAGLRMIADANVSPDVPDVIDSQKAQSPLDKPKPDPKGKEFSFETVTVNSYGKIVQKIQKTTRQKTLDIGGGVALKMVYIPGGMFLMGAPENEQDSFENEHPQHQVTIAPFYMGKYPVTQAQWQAVMGSNPSSFKGEKHPVENVSWHDAQAFIKKLNKIVENGRHAVSLQFRLPTEAEWEYACRAGTTTPFYFGGTITTDVVNYDGSETYSKESRGQYRQKTTDVGSFPPNAFGLYDMHGNVWEWCEDWYDHQYYMNSPEKNPSGPNTGKCRLVRGGSWLNNPTHCRCAFRDWNNPDKRDINWGFRVVAVLVRPPQADHKNETTSERPSESDSDISIAAMMNL